MSELAIFIYGLVVFSIVAAACTLVVYGIITERRSREQLDAGPEARDPSELPPGTETITGPSGRTEAAE